jgi:hypothetical protein
MRWRGFHYQCIAQENIGMGMSKGQCVELGQRSNRVLFLIFA